MKLPVIISIPHAGFEMPSAIKENCLLTQQEILDDGDVFADVIYTPLEDYVKCFLTTPIARAFVDLNRAPDDFRMDGVIKTHTCWQRKIYKNDLSRETIQMLLDKYYFPYHKKLTDFSTQTVKLGIDCHTMADVGPQVGPDAGQMRPDVCLSISPKHMPSQWALHMLTLLKKQFEDVRLNDPFHGGYIMRKHHTEIPWMQLELRRGGISAEQKQQKILIVIQSWCEDVVAL